MKKWFTKLWKVMKICAAQFMITITACGVSLAHDSDAQLLERRISLTVNDVPLQKALKEIETAADIRIFYSIDQLDYDGSVSIQARDKTLRAVLDELLGPHHIRYKVDEKKQVIFLKRERDSFEGRFRSPDESAADRTTRTVAQAISGTVVDGNTHQPMAGVNIILKGTTVGTTSDSEGKYTIEADDDDIIVFSFIGYVTFEAQVGTRRVIDVAMEEDVKNLNEVVVNAGYWKVADRERTGNISRVTAEDIKDQPVSNPLMAIQGRMPGVVITQTSGVPGSGMKIQIRGQNSLRNTPTSNGNLPLYVIDGVPVSSNPIYPNGAILSTTAGGIDPLNTLNPANIESIEILKDADATAIYGSRGANGVVLITTKKGKAGSTNFDIQAYTGAGKASKMMDLMNTEQYLAMRREALANDNVTPEASDYDLNGAWSQTDDRDWQDILFGGTANISDVQGFFSGGTGNTSFRFGGGYHKETTVFPGAFGYSKVTGALSLNHSSADDKFSLTISLNYGRDRNSLLNGNLSAYAYTLAPNAPQYDEQGNLVWTGYSPSTPNPMSYFKTSDISKTGNLISSTVMSYEVVKGLKVITNLGYSNISTNQIIETPLTALSPTAATLSSTNLFEYQAGNWIVEPQIAYSQQIRQGRLDFLAGATWQAFDSKVFSVLGQGYTTDALLGNIKSANTITVGNDSETQYRYNAFFARFGYAWRERYFINLTARRDGSSRFGADDQFGSFGAIGAAWIFSNENFVKNTLPFVSFGKLRASYGTTGSDQIGDYGYISTYEAGSTTYRGTGTLNTSALANPSFGWEVNKKLEAAIDLGFFQNRIQTSVSWYHNRSSNQLVGYPLPAITGFSSVQYNLDATVQNSGLEFELASSNIATSKTQWTTYLNLTVPRNKLLSYPGLAGSSYANTYVVGKPLTISKRYYYDGIDPETGLYKIVDVNGDGSYTDLDKQAVVNLSRRLYAGLSNAITYKSVELNFLLEFVKQNAIDYRTQFVSQPGARLYNQASFILSESRWQGVGDQPALQKFTQSGSTTYFRAASSDLNVTDASYLRLKTISLSYRLSQSILTKLRLKDLTLYIQCQNLITITNYYGLNPESPYLELPPLRVCSAGIKLRL